jgi:GTP-binding protein HflX
VSPELARHLTEVSRRLGRQVGVLLGRDGVIRKVIVGDAHRLTIPDIGRLRGGVGRFRGLRLVHTHLRGEPLSRDDLNDLTLLRLDLIAMVEAQADGLPGRVELAHLAPMPPVPPVPPEDTATSSGNETSGDDGCGAYVRVRAADLYRLDFDVVATLRALEEESARERSERPGGDGRKARERALVLSLRPEEEHFAETLELARAAGVEVAASLRQRRGQIHPKTVVGRGKLQEIVLEGMRRRATVAIFDVDLKPGQARAFEDATGLKAIDRTQLILDVFAQRARSRDGKLQVELAQLRYSLPRLTERDAGLSRLAGGVGGRGPGETVMEIGRRRIRDRIRALERQVESLSRQRDLRRRRRREQRVPVLSIIGYTNAGKSTLLNALTGSQVEVADQLFMTLDPTSRRLRFPREGEVVITDTVGFIAELPRDLVAAFSATLEELADADLLLHVADIADPGLEHKLAAVLRILRDLHLDSIPRLLALNKSDLLCGAEAAALARRHDAVAISAATRAGLPDLIQAAENRLGSDRPLLRRVAGAELPPGPGEAGDAR